jgi:hypothetical protein
MSQEEHRDRDILRGDFFALDGGDDSWEDDVLHGRAAADISHAGEAMPEDPERADGNLFQGLRQNQRCAFVFWEYLAILLKGFLRRQLWGHRRYPDLRTRRNRTQLQVDGFAKQIERMADAYLELGVVVEKGEGLAASYKFAEGTPVKERRDILMVDVFGTVPLIFF